MTDKNTFKLLELIKPEVDFDLSKAPPEPDYSNIASWAALPEIDGQQFYVPDTSFTVNKRNNDIDVFYIHPTGFYEKDWNSDMDKKKSAYERTEIMLGNQASAFNESCNIYAPEYRQATYYSFFDVNNNGRNALDLAYSDIESAFNFFIENLNKDKPFIIAAHSQGALHAHRLINKMVDNTDLKNRLVCAYVIGYIIPEKYYEDLFPNTIKSSSFNDTGCIISWSSVVEGFKRNREKTLFWKPEGWSVELMSQKIVSTNPFSWTNDDGWYADDKNKSIINKAQNYDFTDRLSSEHTGAKKSIGLTRIQGFDCSLNNESGLLEARGALIDSIKKMKYFNGDLHPFDIMLFWGTLRQNIKDRINAYI
tara:strand:- start:3771 stop:4865 length:1095 start_codon:yes stop_codon:yes gene_type:complete